MAQRGQFRVSVSRDDLVFSPSIPLPMPAIGVRDSIDAEVVRVSVDGQPRYLFPLSDCALLPVPNNAVSYRRVTVTLSSHRAGGVTAKDFELAEKFDEVALWRPRGGGALTGTPDKFVRSAS